MTVAVPYDWLKQAPPSLLEQGNISLFGKAPAFPWDQFSAVFAKVFQIESFKIQTSEWQLRNENDLFKGLGNKPISLCLDVSPLQGTLWLAISESDINKLMGLILAKRADASDLIDPDYRQGFLQFLGLEAINVFTKLEYEKGLTPHLLNQAEPPKAQSFCQDISIQIEKVAIPIRLIVSDELNNSWKERFAQRKLSVDIDEDFAKKLEVIVHLEAGKTSLSQNEWKQAAPGDYLILEHCSIDPGDDKGRVMLTINNKPLFRAKVKDGNIKILESPLYHEVESGMVNKNEPNDEEFEDEEFEDEDFDTDLEEEEAEETEAEAAPAEKAPPEKGKAPPAPAAAQAAPKKAPLSPADIPLTIVVEVGRVQMSVQKLLELEPGQLLEMDVHPESGVDLVVNGNVIGKGELLRIGDTIGVRILDKG